MSLYLCAGAFIALAFLQPTNRAAWGILAAAAIAEGLNAQINAYNYIPLQLVRATIVFVGGFCLCYIKTTFSYYQASVYALTLIVYLLLAVDLYYFRAPVLVYDSYERIVHGLVYCQFFGAFITLLGDRVSRPESGRADINHNFRT